MIATTQIKDSPPVISTLIPKQSREKYRAAIDKATKKNTAIYIDNPPERQILLAKILFGDLQTLGILVSSHSIYNKTIIENDVKKAGLKSRIETVTNDDNLISKLSLVLNYSDAFLALPDAGIFNRGTAKNILLTTYRHRTPVIAYSASYVKAGALAAVYTTPQQIADQTGRVLINILQSSLNFPQHDAAPENFEIIINKNVSKSLGIPIHNEDKIKRQLLDMLKEIK
jgi:putative ABC transport system substrate-binding protein